MLGVSCPPLSMELNPSPIEAEANSGWGDAVVARVMTIRPLMA
jgi:hypothetical protein